MDMLNKLMPETRDRRPWNPPAVKAVGTVGEILLGGGGKTSIMPADPGETRKPSGQSGSDPG
jgi:hypothetical protein